MQSTENGFDTHPGQSEVDGLDMMVTSTTGGGVRESRERQQPRPELDGAAGGARASEKRGGCSTSSISSGHVNCLADANGSDKFDNSGVPLRRDGRYHTLGGRPRRSVSFFEQCSPRQQQHSPRRVISHSKSSLSVSFTEDRYITSPLLKASSSMSSLPNSTASTPTTSFVGSTTADSPHFSFASATSFGSPGPSSSVGTLFGSNPDHDTWDMSSFDGSRHTPQQHHGNLSSASSTSSFHSMNFCSGINNGSDLASSVSTSSADTIMAAGAYFSPGPPLRPPTSTGTRHSPIHLDDSNARSNGCFESTSWASAESAADDRWSNPGSVQMEVGQVSDQSVDGLHDDRQQASPGYVAAASSTVVQQDVVKVASVIASADSQFDYHPSPLHPTSRPSSTGSSSHESTKLSGTDNIQHGSSPTSTNMQLKNPGLSNEYLQLYRRMYAHTRRAGRFKSDPQIQTSVAFSGSQHHHSASLQEQDYQVPQFHEGQSCSGNPSTPTPAGQKFDVHQQPEKRKSPLQSIQGTQHGRSPNYPGPDTHPDSTGVNKNISPEGLIASPPAPSVVTARNVRSNTISAASTGSTSVSNPSAPHTLSLAQRRLLRRQKSRDLSSVRKQLSSDRRKMDVSFKQQAYRAGMTQEAVEELLNSTPSQHPPADFNMMDTETYPPQMSQSFDSYSTPTSLSSEDLQHFNGPVRHHSMSSLETPLIADDSFDANNISHFHSAEELHRAFSQSFTEDQLSQEDWTALQHAYALQQAQQAAFEQLTTPIAAGSFTHMQNPPSPMNQDSPPHHEFAMTKAPSVLSPPDSPGYAFSCGSPGNYAYAPPPTPGYAANVVQAVDLVFSSLPSSKPYSAGKPNPSAQRRQESRMRKPSKELVGNMAESMNGTGMGAGGMGGNKAETTFVNFTPKDANKILSGVAPSGSSKTKARREKEAMERRRRIGEVVEREVVRVGGDGRGVRERVELL